MVKMTKNKGIADMLFRDLVLGVRIPAALLAAAAVYNTSLFYASNKAHLADAKFGSVTGRLIDIQKKKYPFMSVPRYAVHYEYDIDGKTYTSRRATSGSPYRDWMGQRYTDTITESQYLQSFPILRIGEPCHVLYDKKNPQAHASLAHDANSWEMALMTYLAVFPLLMANNMRDSYNEYKNGWKTKKTKVRFPQWARTVARP